MSDSSMISNLEHMSLLGKSDHCCLTFDFNCYVNIKESLKIARLYERGNYQDFKYDLDQYDWLETLKESENIDTNWDKFLAILKAKRLICSRFEIIGSSFVIIKSIMCGVSVPLHLVSLETC
jgi:hypothetical protein